MLLPMESKHEILIIHSVSETFIEQFVLPTGKNTKTPKVSVYKNPC